MDLMVTSEALGFPMRYLLGLSPEIDEDTGEPRTLPDLKPEVDAFWAFWGEQLQAGQFPAAELGQLIAEVNDHRVEIGRASRTPPHLMFMTTGEIPSGEALKVVEAPFTAKVDDCATTFGNTWEDVEAFCLLIESDQGVRVLLAAEWEDAQPVSRTGEGAAGRVLAPPRHPAADDSAQGARVHRCRGGAGHGRTSGATERAGRGGHPVPAGWAAAAAARRPGGQDGAGIGHRAAARGTRGDAMTNQQDWPPVFAEMAGSPYWTSAGRRLPIIMGGSADAGSDGGEGDDGGGDDGDDPGAAPAAKPRAKAKAAAGDADGVADPVGEWFEALPPEGKQYFRDLKRTASGSSKAARTAQQKLDAIQQSTMSTEQRLQVELERERERASKAESRLRTQSVQGAFSREGREQGAIYPNDLWRQVDPDDIRWDAETGEVMNAPELVASLRSNFPKLFEERRPTSSVDAGRRSPPQPARDRTLGS